jgi:hypothetical protein
MMLNNGALTPEFIKEEVAKGHIRPSLVPQLDLEADFRGKTFNCRQLLRFDRRADYVIHKKLMDWMEQRKQAHFAIRAKEDPEGFRRWRRKEMVRNFVRHPVKFIRDPRKRL